MPCITGRNEYAIAAPAGKENHEKYCFKSKNSDREHIVALAADGGWAGVLIGSACVGFANGCGVPCIISAASREAGRSAATDVMPLISAALYLAQFLSPFMLSLVRDITASGAVRLPYYTAVAVSAALLLWSGVKKAGSKA